MKKNLFISLFLGSAILTYAQTSTELDTIYANDKMNVALLFPNPIVQGITGSENFVFTYNREFKQNLGLLQATKGSDSNLLIVDSKGFVFSYIISYKSSLNTFNYFLSDSSSIGNLKKIDHTDKAEFRSLDSLHSNDENLLKFCKFLIHRKVKKPIARKKSYDIILSLDDVVFEEDKFYMTIGIKNTSSLDYDLNFLRSYIQTKKMGKKTSMQRILKVPVYQYRFPEKIEAKSSNRVILVFPKFSLSRDKKFIFELNEKNGERNMKLFIKNKFINDPN